MITMSFCNHINVHVHTYPYSSYCVLKRKVSWNRVNAANAAVVIILFFNVILNCSVIMQKMECCCMSMFKYHNMFIIMYFFLEIWIFISHRFVLRNVDTRKINTFSLKFTFILVRKRIRVEAKSLAMTSIQNLVEFTICDRSIRLEITYLFINVRFRASLQFACLACNGDNQQTLVLLKQSPHERSFATRMPFIENTIHKVCTSFNATWIDQK